ncbi:hypothetical protein BDN70DRAFT_940151, partial [Pholiota conissans]
MIYLLQNDVQTKLGNQVIRFINTIHSRAILHAYSQDQSGAEPYNINGNTFLHKFGRSLSQAKRLGGIFHVHGNHWVALYIDVDNEEIAYGDPADSDSTLAISEPALDKALRWFFSKHIPSLQALDQLDEVILPTARQDLSGDSWNCGIYSFNALSHAFFKDRPLLIHTSSDTAVAGDLARLDVLRQIIAHFNSSNSLTDQAAETQFNVAALLPQLDLKSTDTSLLTSKTICPTKVSAMVKVTSNKKKRKTNFLEEGPSTPVRSLESYLTPKFNVNKANSKRTRIDSTCDGEETLETTMPQGWTESETTQDTPLSHGRPRLGILDELTIEITTD